MTHVSNICTKANPWIPETKLTFLSPEGKGSSLQRIGAPGLAFGLGLPSPLPRPMCRSSGQIRERAKARSQIRDRKLQI